MSFYKRFNLKVELRRLARGKQSAVPLSILAMLAAEAIDAAIAARPRQANPAGLFLVWDGSQSRRNGV